MKEGNRGYNRTVGKELYISGNTVREYRVEMDPQIERQNEQQRRINHEVRRKQEKAEAMNLGYALFIIAAVCITFFVCTNYLKMVSGVSATKKNVSNLEQQVTELSSNNDAYQRRLDSSINPDQIRSVAMNELGMVYAGSSQVIKYDYQESDYVRQYEEIPKTAKGSLFGSE